MLLDKSGSISQTDLNAIIKFTENMITVFNVAPSGAHMGIVKFSEYSNLVMCLTGSSCALNMSMHSSLFDDPKDSLFPQTDFTEAFQGLINEFNLRARHEWDSRYIVVLLSDGDQTKGSRTEAEALLKQLHASKYSFWVVAVGANSSGIEWLRNTVATSTSTFRSLNNYTDLAYDLALTIVGDTCKVINYGSCTHVTWVLCLLILIHCVHINFILWRHPPIMKWRRIAIWDYWFVSVLGGVLFILSLVMISSSDAAIRNGLCSAIIAFVVIDLLATIAAICVIWIKSPSPTELAANPNQTISKAAASTYVAGGGTMAAMTAFRTDGDKVTAPTMAGSTVTPTSANPLTAGKPLPQLPPNRA
eukprot:GAFH01001930.1.p1 GENE.GAFH01001930.1~~GAFH01001930.1.p1  ORF type:complete len:399 (+),score=120.71 GAFH01001930.1:115-1197(+)